MAVVATISVTMASCIKNDLPYPHIQANFLSFEVENALQQASIDSTALQLTVYLNESADIRNIKVTDYSVTAGATVEGIDLTQPIDLASPCRVTLKLYQDYEWTLSAIQNIERYFTVENQIGKTDIDTENHTVHIFIPDTHSLTSVHVLTMKLGAEGSSTSDNLAGRTVDFTSPVTVEVTTHGVTVEWTITVEQTTAPVTTVSADGWTCVGWVYGEAQQGKNNGVEYRKETDTEWIKVPAEWITHNGGSFTARIIHLEPLTNYVVRAYSEEDYGEELTFTTGVALQVPNCDFNNWWLEGKVWNPWAEGGEKFWDTGNKGATTLGQSNTTPTGDTPTGTGTAAMLNTKFVGVSILGKLAAGNIFTGDYVRTEGTNGVLSFGREFTQRPTKLRGSLKYTSVLISNTDNNAPQYIRDMKGQPDTCIVWIALSDKGETYTIRTKPSERQLFNPDDPSVVAYGNFQLGKTVNEYIPFEITLDYRATNRIPTHIVIVGSASKYGDYFTGGDGSTLWLDDLELVYDY